MRFQVNSSALHKQLSRIIGVVPSNPLVPILENVLIEAKADKLILTASDLQTSIAASVPSKGNGTTSIAAPAKPLLDILKNLPDQGITLDIDGTHLQIISDNGKYNLGGMEPVDFPREWGVKGAKEFTIEAVELDTALETTVFATSDDFSMPSICGVCFQKKDNLLRFVAMHAFIISRYQIKNDSQDFEFVVPKKSLGLVKQMANDNVQVTVRFNDGFVSFNNGIVHIRTKLIEERFINYEAGIPKDHDKKAIADRKNVLTAIKRVSTCSNKKDHLVRLKFDNNALEISTEDTEFSRTAKETLAVEYSGEPFEMGANGRFFLDILNHLISEEVIFTFSSPKRALLVFPKDDDSTLMLLMPVFLPQTVEA